MFGKKELAYIIVISIILAFVVSLSQQLEIFPEALLFIFLVIIINSLAKKIQAFYLESKIEIRIWEMSQYGIKASRRFKKPVPAGAIVPLIIAVLSFGYIPWLASLTFETSGKVYKAARKHGLYKFSEVPEYHIGLIAAAGIIGNLLFAIIGYLLGYEMFANLNVLFALFNLIPFSELDGTKIWFGSKVLYTLLAILTLLFLAGVFIIV